MTEGPAQLSGLGGAAGVVVVVSEVVVVDTEVAEGVKEVERAQPR